MINNRGGGYSSSSSNSGSNSAITKERKALIKSFAESCECTEDGAEYFLRQCYWNLDRAINAYLNDKRAQRLYKKRLPVLGDLFDELVSHEGENAGAIDDIEQLASHIGVDPNSLSLFILSWKLDCKKLGVFTRDEWIDGLTLSFNGIKSFEDIHTALTKLEEEVLLSLDNFRPLYEHIFCVVSQNGKNMPILDAADLLEDVLPEKLFGFKAQFITFLREYEGKKKSEYLAEHSGSDAGYKCPVLSRDAWLMLLDFNKTVDPKMENYDSWPLIMDEFVDWSRETWLK